MTISMMATAMLVAFCALLTWVTLFKAVPWLAQRATVYGLHGLRDRLGRLGDEHRWLRSTVMYRDADFILAVALRLSRDAGWFHFAHAVRNQLVAQPSEAPLPPAYATDLAQHFASPERERILAELGRIVDGRRYWFLLRVSFGHAIAIPFSLLTMMFAFLRQTYQSLAPGPDVPESLTAALLLQHHRAAVPGIHEDVRRPRAEPLAS